MVDNTEVAVHISTCFMDHMEPWQATTGDNRSIAPAQQADSQLYPKKFVSTQLYPKKFVSTH